ncbi:MAG TPA: DNA repair protein RecN [Bryobacteraceae bacterium]|nr:DNA repair protein RecN [Bryobacteraceae bacterium]
MIAELAVENYAVIERLRVRFHRGLNLLTGETGSGKSIVVDALGLLFGGRASSDMIRAGADRARVSGIFEVTSSPSLIRVLDGAGIEIEDNELLVEREILANGKSRAFVASRPVTGALLRELAPYLGDIHGQHDQQQLFKSESQREMLDSFAGSDDGIASLYDRWRRASAELDELDRTAQEKLRLADLWSFQRNEIEAVAPLQNEDAELENERRVLRNVVKIEESANAAYAALYDAEESATAQLQIVLKKLEELSRIDEGVAIIAATLKPAVFAVEEAADALRHYLGKLEADPNRLDEVESRMAALEKLKRKYGTTIAEVLMFLEDVRKELNAVETSSDRQTALKKEVAGLAASYETAAKKLTAARIAAAKRLSKAVEAELASLAMERTKIEICVEPAPWSEHGADSVEFLMSANAGEEPKPLDRIASGGELSRVALALKTCASRPGKGTPRTLVFDEVDAGVGGSAAEAVGRRLKKLSTSSQLLCVTHLPQIAGFADHHYYVEKHEERGRTLATIVELTPAQRTKEIGRMLSGERVTAEALKHAEQLIKLAAE